MITAAKLGILVTADTRQAEQALSGMSKTIDGFGRSAMEIGKKMTAFVTVPLLGVGTAAVKVAADFDRNMNVLRANSGATADELEQLRKKAMELGADLTLPSTSASNAAEAMLELSKAGMSVTDTMKASRGVLELAAAAQMSNAQAAEVTANALNAFGLEASESNRVADLLAASANKASGDVTDMADALKMSSAVFASAKIPIEDLTTAIALMANAGIKGSDAGTSLKQMMLSLQAPTAKAKSTMQDLGIAVYDARGNMLPLPQIIDNFSQALGGLNQEQRNFALATIFGSDAVRAANVVLMGGATAFNTMKDGITETGVAADIAKAQTEGLGGAMGKLKSSFSTAMLAAVQPVQEDLVALADTIAGLATAFSKLDDDTREAIVDAGMIAAALGPAIFAFGAMDKAIILAGKAFNIFAGGIGLVIDSVGGMVTATGAFIRAWQAGLTLQTALEVALGSTAVALGAVALMVGSVAAVWYTWNEQIVKTNQAGAKAADDTWTKFLNDQVESGKSAIQVADEYNAAQDRVRQQLEDTNPILRLFIANQDELTQATGEVLNQALIEAASSYEEYRAAAKKVGDEVKIVSQAEYQLRRDMEAASKANVESADSILKTAASYETYVARMKEAGLLLMVVSEEEYEAANASRALADAATGAADAMGAVGAAVLESSDIMGILSDSLQDAKWSEDAQAEAMRAIEIALGKVSPETAQLTSDVEMLSQAFAEGVISEAEYTAAMQAAQEGTLDLSDAQREQYQTSLDQAEALKAATAATQEMLIAQLNLAMQFSSAWASAQEQYNSGMERFQQKQASIADKIAETRQKIREAKSELNRTSDPEKAAQLRQKIGDLRQELTGLKKDSSEAAQEMGKLADEMQRSIETQLAQQSLTMLGQAYDKGQISFETYLTASTEVATTFGMLNEQGVALSTGLLMITKALEEGTLPATQYDDALKALATDAADGTVDIQGLLQQFGVAPAQIDPATQSVEGASTALKDFGTDAQTAATQAQTSSQKIQSAFKTPDWEGLGQNIAQGIAAGITAGAPAVADAAAQAASDAYAASSGAVQAKSPSRLFSKLGGWMMEGLGLGVKDKAEEPIRETERAMKGTLNASRDQVTQAGGGGIKAVLDQVAGMMTPGQARQPIYLTVNVGGHELRRVMVDAFNQELSA